MLTIAVEPDSSACSRATPVIDRFPVAGRCLTVDLTRVTFMDAGGLDMLLRLRRRFVAGSGTMELRNAHPRVRLVLELTGTDTQFREAVLQGLPGV